MACGTVFFLFFLHRPLVDEVRIKKASVTRYNIVVTPLAYHQNDAKIVDRLAISWPCYVHEQ